MSDIRRPARLVGMFFLRAGISMAIPLALVLALSGCKKDGNKDTVLAQVGNASLTLEELRESFPAEYEQLIRREQYLDFIKRWIDDEVLYQQAMKARLDDDPLIKRKLDKLLRKALIEEFLAREGSAETFEPDEMSMNQYYEMHKEEFRRKVPEFKFAHIRVASAKTAADIRYKAQTDNAFLAQAAAQSQDPTPESVASLPYKKQAELPPCLAGEIAAGRPGMTTNPIACPDGVYLVRILDRLEAGSLIPFAEAKDEISATLLMERKDKLLEGRVQKYKEGIAISYNLDQIPGLTETAAAPASSSDTSVPAAASASDLAAEAVRLDAVEPTPPAPKPVRRRPRPVAPAAPAAAAAPPSQPAAETAAPAPVQEENANVPKPPETSP